MNTVKIIFRCSKKNTEEGYLSLRVYYQQQSKQISTGLKIRKEEWDNKHSQIVLTNFTAERRDYLSKLNSELQNKVFHLERLLADFHKKGGSNIVDLIRSYKFTTSANSFSSYVQILSEKLVHETRYRTSSAYLSTMRRIIRFNNNQDFPLDKITADYIESFERHLFNQRLSLNTISFYIRNLRAIYNRAIADKVLLMNLENPFTKVFTGVKSTLSVPSLKKS